MVDPKTNQNLFGPVENLKYRRLHTRVPAALNADIKFSSCCEIQITIDEISKGGMRVISDNNIPFGPLEVIVHFKDHDLALQCEQVWVAGKKAGLRISVPSPEWNQIVEKYLDKAS